MKIYSENNSTVKKNSNPFFLKSYHHPSLAGFDLKTHSFKSPGVPNLLALWRGFEPMTLNVATVCGHHAAEATIRHQGDRIGRFFAQ
jgi:hypothetical protein